MGIRIIKYLRYVVHCLLEVIYAQDSEVCILCKEVIAEGEDLCIQCRKKMAHCRDSYEIRCVEADTFPDISLRGFTCYSSAYYTGSIQELILKLKYSSDFKSGEILANMMYETMKLSSETIDEITFVPASRKNFKKRGFNQCKYLAVNVGRKMNIPVKDYLIKCKETKDQIGLSSSSRWGNLKGSFKCRSYNELVGKRILLIDDVLTTGATAFFCADALITSGVQEVIILTAAKSRI